MDDKIREAMEELKSASPLEATKILQEMELYDAKTSQEVIDEVYQQFETSENIVESVVFPVFASILDGVFEIGALKNLRKKGITASRVLQECKNFDYGKGVGNHAPISAYAETKNMREYDDKNPNMTQTYQRENYESKKAMDDYKKHKARGKTAYDEYQQGETVYISQKDPDLRRSNDATHRHQAQPDHITPLKQIHDKYKNNYALDDSDLKRIANIDDNLAVTSAEINQLKRDMTNEEFIKWMDEKGTPLDERTKEKMLELQKSSEQAIENEVKKTVADNLMGNGQVDEKTMKAEVEKYKQEHNGASPSKEEKEKIKQTLIKKKQTEIIGTTAKNAANQAKEYAVGNVILFIVKPLFFEIKDIIMNGLREGVNAESGTEAIKIRFGRIKDYVMANAAAFFGDSIIEFIKGFISSLIEGIIGLFVGMLKQVLKIVKEGIRIFVQSAQILFGADSKEMSPAQKGDAIVKLIGGTIISLAGIGIEALLNKLGITGDLATIISTILSGIASALFMYLLDKVDLFSVKAEKRRDRIFEIFNERIADIKEAVETCNTVAINTLVRHRERFDDISCELQNGISSDNIDVINQGLYEMADFMKVELPYKNTDEFCDFMDSDDVLVI